MRGLAHSWAMALLALLAPIEATARATDPRVPPGTDPGGIAVALISTGIDYTLPHISARLARDGEGEIIGWDFADDDALPYEDGPQSHATALANLLLAEAPGARLIPVRIDTEQPAVLARAMAFVGRTPARLALVAVPVARQEDWEAIHQAAQHFAELLIIVPVDTTGFTHVADAENILTVAAASDSASGGRLDGADLSITLSLPIDSAALRLPASTAAVAQAGASVVALAAESPATDAAGLKRIIVQQHSQQAK